MYEQITQLFLIATQCLVNCAIEAWDYTNEFYFDEDAMDEPQPTCPPSFFLGTIADPEEFAWEHDIWNYFFNTSEDNEEDIDPNPSTHTTITHPVNYVDKYKKELKERLTNTTATKEHTEVPLANFKQKVLIENTPFGNVIMYYDSTKSSFVYYCDKTLSYPIVNTVGRKYVLTFRCENLYMDESVPSNNNNNNNPSAVPDTNAQKALPEKEASSIPQNKNVYAKFKNYKKPKTTPTQTSSTTSAIPSAEEQINRYTCEGKISNFSFLQTAPKIKRLSYKDFKRTIKSS